MNIRNLSTLRKLHPESDGVQGVHPPSHDTRALSAHHLSSLRLSASVCCAC